MVIALASPHVVSRLNPETTSTSNSEIITQPLSVITQERVMCTPTGEAGRAGHESEFGSQAGKQRKGVQRKVGRRRD